MKQPFVATSLVRLINLLTPAELLSVLEGLDDVVAPSAEIGTQCRQVFDLLQHGDGSSDQMLVAERILNLDSMPCWMVVTAHFGLDDSFQYNDLQQLAYIADYLGAVDCELAPEILEAKYSPTADGEHPDFQKLAWRQAVSNEETLLGYWVWVAKALRQG